MIVVRHHNITGVLRRGEGVEKYVECTKKVIKLLKLTLIPSIVFSALKTGFSAVRFLRRKSKSRVGR